MNNRVRHSNDSVSKTESNSTPETSVPSSLELARIGIFSALIALGTILTNGLLGVPLPPPLVEITAAPAFYMAIAVLFSRKVSFWSTLIGSAIGEFVNVVFGFAGVAAIFALTFVPGMILARAPEALIINRFRMRTIRWIAVGMVLATIYETIVFFMIDWPVYALTSFYQSKVGIVDAFWLAFPDVFTMVDLVWIPVSIAIILAVRRAFNRNFLD